MPNYLLYCTVIGCPSYFDLSTGSVFVRHEVPITRTFSLSGLGVGWIISIWRFGYSLGAEWSDFGIRRGIKPFMMAMES